MWPRSLKKLCESGKSTVTSPHMFSRISDTGFKAFMMENKLSENPVRMDQQR